MLTNGEDTLFQFISISNAKKISLNKEIISIYRIRNNSVSHTLNLNRIDVMFSYYRIITLAQNISLQFKDDLILKYKIMIIDFIQVYIKLNKKTFILNNLKIIFEYIKIKYKSLFLFLLKDSNFYDLTIKYKIKRFFLIKFFLFVKKY